MQESKQELTHYYKTIFTLKNGKQIEICHKETFQKASELKSENGICVVQMSGFITTPLFVEKSIEIQLSEVAAVESIKDPCIAQVVPWPEGGEALGTIVTGQTKEELAEPNQADNKTMVEHSKTCAVHNNPPKGFASEVSQCDCGAIVACGNSKAVEDMTTKELVEMSKINVHLKDCKCPKCAPKIWG
ncbi:hypothetical protein LCGC14_1984600 [marine sediment metagenome]|uniref:Uncharacterized protein n=1 Tax=marine sediment metagenome TaxID=412755 RepID=A0A0F9I4Z3_9ZZZZ